MRGSQTSAENDPLVAVIKVGKDFLDFFVNLVDWLTFSDETGDSSADVADGVEHHHV